MSIAGGKPKLRVKDVVDITQALFTIAAIIAGGWWFFAQRSDKPQVKLEQIISRRPLANSPHRWLVCVDVRATNVGKTKVTLDEGIVDLTQVNPIPGEDLSEIKLRRLVLEPGESDQALFKTYQVPDYIKTIEVHSRYAVPKSKVLFWESQALYWNLRSLVDIDTDQAQAVKSGVGG